MYLATGEGVFLVVFVPPEVTTIMTHHEYNNQGPEYLDKLRRKNSTFWLVNAQPGKVKEMYVFFPPW